MRVLYHNRRPVVGDYRASPTDLPNLLRESDFVSIHTPLTPQTHHLFNQETIASMKRGAILVNTARGGVVDAQALADALGSGHLAAAALDVTDPEPISPDDPLLALPNCIIVPHIASASIGTRNRMADMSAQNLLAGVRGERLPNCVNPEVYEGGRQNQ
jgi:lactate dehydrogenase-like 2-hydroxyacid dehydrogenase